MTSPEVQRVIGRIVRAEEKMTFDICHVERDEYAREAYDLAIQVNEADSAEHEPWPPETKEAVRSILERYGLNA